MARNPCSKAHHRHQHNRPLETVALLLMCAAETDHERIAAISMALLALKEKKKGRNGRYGLRGPYNAPKSKDFFDLLFNEFSDQWFKSWIR